MGFFIKKVVSSRLGMTFLFLTFIKNVRLYI
nr:MAG TPA: hypothetical protein [Caudoviricetes sp.]